MLSCHFSVCFVCMKKGFLFFSVLVIAANYVTAQQHSFHVRTEQRSFDGLSKNVQPGDSIYLLAGSRGELQIENITGTPEKPVVIVNSGGKVIIQTEKDFGILFTNSVHFKLTGTGSTDKYGIEIASTANHGLVITEFSSYAEADHLEIHHVGYAGVVAKTDPNCSRKDLRYFVMNNLSFHDNLIHDTNAEGFYIGYSWYPARVYTCGEDSLLYSHPIQGIRIYNNIIQHSGQEAIQVGTGTGDIKIYSNRIENYGTNNIIWQNHGVQIGQGTTGEFFNNTIQNGPGEAISLFGGGNNAVYGNVIINSGASAIYQNDRGALPGTHYYIRNNTIVNPESYGIMLVSDHTKGNRVNDNTIFIKRPDSAIVNNGSMRWESPGNKIAPLVENPAFNDSLLQTVYKTNVEYIPFSNKTLLPLLTEHASGDHFYLSQVNAKKQTINIYNDAGVLLNDRPVIKKSKGWDIDLSGLPEGIYYISVLSEGRHVQLKRVVRFNQF